MSRVKGSPKKRNWRPWWDHWWISLASKWVVLRWNHPCNFFLKFLRRNPIMLQILLPPIFDFSTHWGSSRWHVCFSKIRSRAFFFRTWVVQLFDQKRPHLTSQISEQMVNLKDTQVGLLPLLLLLLPLLLLLLLLLSGVKKMNHHVHANPTHLAMKTINPHTHTQKRGQTLCSLSYEPSFIPLFLQHFGGYPK